MLPVSREKIKKTGGQIASKLLIPFRFQDQIFLLLAIWSPSFKLTIYYHPVNSSVAATIRLLLFSEQNPRRSKTFLPIEIYYVILKSFLVKCL